MKSNLEKQLCEERDSVETLVKAKHADVEEILCSFSELDCIADVKLESGEWLRYTLILNGDDEENEIRRIG